jgi:MFS family permease
MRTLLRLPLATRVIAVGALGLACGMGIGRFALTPLLPLLQESPGLSLQQGSWLASANYAGYLLGALLCVALAPRPQTAARAGLAGVALLTSAMGVTESFALWLALRAAAGVASAFVLVGVSSWALAALAREQRAQLSGLVFAGVGCGIVLVGVLGLAAGVFSWPARAAWLLLGALAGGMALAAWPALGDEPHAAAQASNPVRAPLTAGIWRLILCYGVFGFGYIIPATFLPTLGRQLFAEPLMFGWAWPVFGLAAAASTLASVRWLGRAPPQRVFALGMLVMALGVVAPALGAGLPALLLCAVCVGGTFMVVTLAGLQEARAVAGANAPRAIAAMTAAFALGQLIGPLTLGPGSIDSAIAWPSLAAALALVCGAAVLLQDRSRRAAVPFNPPRSP